ncbi:aldo/keto reductase [Kushneria indalinina]|uniref:Diketogulonate reductase-like aldo/keto reductase n=1 Tax=Kushneria indalinina DSM 14324 TaxID=1122140 RepID=A0A3D9DWG9_9GAMM|nr:aldo/keto reductase [Kushneria indalinina]REC95133.1 diketogulonate reductase-like aldo/keto reductase [Kushneria indalinina DSM 14324]
MPLSIPRRRFLIGLTATGLAARWPQAFAGRDEAPITRSIPSTGEALPVIGMGTWRTFNVGTDPELLDQRAEILELFFQRGGRVVDASPMYGSAEEAVGELIERLDRRDDLFAATKVWTRDETETREAVARSEALWGVARFDLMQIHNLLGWEGHLATLKEMKAAGRLRYIGVTTSHGRRHDELERIMTREPLDFVQLTYNIADREAEERLLPLARERGIAVIANRPFQGGQLFDRVGSQPLPAWAGEVGAESWAGFFLKFIVSHPAMTCAIPATTQVAHMRENMGALYGRLPDETQRQRMIDHVQGL